MRWEQDNDLKSMGHLGLFDEYLSMGQFLVISLVCFMDVSMVVGGPRPISLQSA